MAKKRRRKPSGKPARKTARKTGSKSVRKPPAKARRPRMARHTRRADLGASADGYFAGITPAGLNAVARRLREIVRGAAPRASEAIKWGMPVYEQDGMLCYIRARPAYVTLGFYEAGTQLADPAGRLEGSGANMRHVKVAEFTAIDDELFGSWVRHAAAFNAEG